MIEAIRRDPSDPEVQTYRYMAQGLFDDVQRLFDQVKAQLEDGQSLEVGSQMAVGHTTLLPQKESRQLIHGVV